MEMEKTLSVFHHCLKIVCIAVYLVLNLIPINSAYADNTHYNSTLIGERATGMGGAFCALSDNTAGLFYNPAGVVHTEGKLLSGSVNIFQFTDKKYKGFYDDQEFNKTSFGIVGAYTGYITPLWGGKAGFSIAVPDSVKEEVKHEWKHLQGWGYPGDSGESNEGYFDTPFTSSAILEIDHEYHLYHFGPSFAYSFGPGFSLGLTIYSHYKKLREIKLIFKQAEVDTVQEDENTATYYNDYYENFGRTFYEVGIKPVLGVQYRKKELSLGLTVAHTMLFDSKDEYREIVSIWRHSENNDPIWADSSSLTHYSLENDQKRRYPVLVRGGVSYKISPDLLMAADCSFFSKSKRRVYSKGIERSFEDDPIVNVAIGGEYRISEKYLARMGLFTDFASTPSSDEELYQLESEHIDLYGLSLSISRKNNKNSYITVGATIRQGNGKACLREDPELIQDVNQFSLALFISAAI